MYTKICNQTYIDGKEIPSGTSLILSLFKGAVKFNFIAS